LGTDLSAKNKGQVSGSLTGPVLRNSCAVINLHQETLTKLDRKTRKLLTIYGYYHNKASIDRWYFPRKPDGGGGGRADTVIRSLAEAYIAAVKRLMEYA
jgi:hypothetical protein